MNFQYDAQTEPFFNLGRLFYDFSQGPVFRCETKDQFAIYFYDFSSEMNDKVFYSRDENYLRNRVGPSFIKSRRFLPPRHQEYLQKIISAIHHRAHEKDLKKRFNISQIGFVWDGGSVPRHNHQLPENYPTQTMTYFVSLNRDQKPDLKFNLYSPGGNQIESLSLCQTSHCTRVIFDSNKDHELLVGRGMYFFMFFDSVIPQEGLLKMEDLTLDCLQE